MYQRTFYHASKDSEIEIETKWLQSAILNFYICKICHVLSLCTTEHNITALAIMHGLRDSEQN